MRFYKVEEKGRRSCHWDAVRGKRSRVPGTFMAAGTGLPHDLSQYVVEAATGYERGFWGLLDRGATFRSTGRKVTRPGRAIVAAHRRELDLAEGLAAHHTGRWQAGALDPVTAALTRALEQWRVLTPGEAIVFTWPSPNGEIESPAAAAS
ncbi:MAG TPA: hypothetical protein VK277_10645 [Acidimicrobiales bacterium]|nr:hypothetical protein [Acidimicrobiales bacterium]